MHCWNPWTYKCSNHALPKYRDNRNGKWQIVKARLYFELGHKLRQTAAINYRVRHSSQVAYNSSRAIFDLFHIFISCGDDELFLLCWGEYVTSLTTHSYCEKRPRNNLYSWDQDFFIKRKPLRRPWKILKCCFSTQPLVWFPNPLAAGSQRDGDPVYSAPHPQAPFML